MPLRRMHRRRRISIAEIKSEAVWVALSGAKLCRTCNNYKTSGKIVKGVLFCDDCDEQLHFPWPVDAQRWQSQ